MVMKESGKIINININITTTRQAKVGRKIMRGASATLGFCGRWRSRSLLVTGSDLFRWRWGVWYILYIIIIFHVGVGWAVGGVFCFQYHVRTGGGASTIIS